MARLESCLRSRFTPISGEARSVDFRARLSLLFRRLLLPQRLPADLECRRSSKSRFAEILRDDLRLRPRSWRASPSPGPRVRSARGRSRQLEATAIGAMTSRSRAWPHDSDLSEPSGNTRLKKDSSPATEGRIPVTRTRTATRSGNAALPRRCLQSCRPRSSTSITPTSEVLKVN